MHIIIAGEGRLLYFLSKSFCAKGYRVTVITDCHKDAEHISRLTKSAVLTGNASDPGVLREADAYYCDLLISVANRDEDNLIISQLAKQEFGISKTIALVNDPDNLTVFQQLGCKAFSPTEMISKLLEQSVQTDEILQVLPTEEGKILITEFRLNADCPILNKPLRDIDRPDQSLLVCIMRQEQVIVPNGDSILQADDKIIVMSIPENHSQVIRMITGEKT